MAPLPEKLSTGSLAAVGLKGFAGTVNYETTLDLPTDAVLEIASGNAFTQVLIDGVDLGTRAWAPFVWNVPANRTGKNRRLTVRVATSMLPIFGDPEAPGAVWKRAFYHPPRAGESDPGLLSVKVSP